MRHFTISALCLLGASLVPGGAANAQAPALPDGPGHDIVAVACVQCHNPQPFTQLRMSQAGWHKQIENMILRGAQIGPDDIDAAATYLATNYGPGVPLPNQPKMQVNLIEGAGSNLVAGGCGICHGLDRVVAANRPGEQWQAIVDRMVQIGAPLDNDQSKQIVSYLEAHYSAPAPK